MFDDRIARRVGAVMLVLVGLASAAVVMVDCSRLRPGIAVDVLYRHVGSLSEGADVELAGRTIGVVKSITLLPPSAVRDPSHPLHPDGGVAVHLRLQKRYAGWTALNSEIVITTKGILGEPYLEVGPPAGGAARQRPLSDGDQVRGVDPARMDQVLLHGYLNMTAFRALLDDIAPSAPGSARPARPARRHPQGHRAQPGSLRPAGRQPGPARRSARRDQRALAGRRPRPG